MQDFVILAYSVKRDGRSLGKMARDEIGPVGGFTALVGVLLIIIIIIAYAGRDSRGFCVTRASCFYCW